MNEDPPVDRSLQRNLPRIPILVGATGVGKSEIAGLLAVRLGAEILSADAFQVFKGMEVGTAQPSSSLRRKVKHHLVGTLRPGEPWNAAEFAKRASRIVRQGILKGKTFLIVGGAGFYLKALVEGLPEGPGTDPRAREKASRMEREQAMAHLWEKDPEAAERLKDLDLKRLRRAVEKTLALKSEVDLYEPLRKDRVRFFGLERSRSGLDERLKKRTKAIWSGGLLSEASALEKLELSPEHPVWGAIGFQEASSYRRGELSEEAALERIFRRTRQYAKRQGTWFRRQHQVEWIELEKFPDPGTVAEELARRIANE